MMRTIKLWFDWLLKRYVRTMKSMIVMWWRHELSFGFNFLVLYALSMPYHIVRISPCLSYDGHSPFFSSRITSPVSYEFVMGLALSLIEYYDCQWIFYIFSYLMKAWVLFFPFSPSVYFRGTIVDPQTKGERSSNSLPPVRLSYSF